MKEEWHVRYKWGNIPVAATISTEELLHVLEELKHNEISELHVKEFSEDEWLWKSFAKEHLGQFKKTTPNT